MPKSQPNMSNDYGIPPKDVFAGAQITIGLFSEIEDIGQRVVRHGDECMPMSIVILDRSTGMVYHSALDTDHLLERFELLIEDRRVKAESDVPAKVILASKKIVDAIIHEVRHTVFVPKHFTVRHKSETE